MPLLDVIKKSISGWLERRREEAVRREEERRRQAEMKRREEEYKRAMYRKGNEFEDHVMGMFPRDRFELIHRTPTNDETGGRYVHSMIYPDLRFRDKVTERKFWVEVKYRSYAEKDGSIVWCADNQLTNYKRTMYESGEKAFIIIGVGGTVHDPDRVHCLDLEDINFTKLFYSTYRNHRITSGTVESLEQLQRIASSCRHLPSSSGS
ncbi:MAG: hypothetical protein IKG94_02825 [Candidatus Methanomethylophilaceae archaeon]|nr:hypothetical protein [Candidatus Methanomethylophilaceae archaeon]MBR4225303.1 hypothetical protein [Candidatus Methanomethylophilaceae archaeon]